MNAFVLNFRNCNFKVTLVKIESIKQASVFVSLSFDVNACGKEEGKEKMGDFIFMMVECLRTDDYAIFRNELRLVLHFVKILAKNCIRHLHTSHNVPYLAPTILRKHGFQFLLGRL